MLLRSLLDQHGRDCGCTQTLSRVSLEDSVERDLPSGRNCGHLAQLEREPEVRICTGS